MPNLLKTMGCGALTLALAACAHGPVYDESPHHFSQDYRGNRIACYATEIANEYECVPTARRYARADPYYYDPFWSFGLWYGWPHYHVIDVPQQPAPRPNPPPHWRRPR